MLEGGIYWTTGEQLDIDSELICSQHPLLHGAFGSVDGLNLPVSINSDPELENATYNGWLHSHVISSVLVFSPRGELFVHFLSCNLMFCDVRHNNCLLS